MISKHGALLSALIAVVSTGCAMSATNDAAEEGSIGEVSQALTIRNGYELNGTVTNGSFLNGIKTNGIKTNGIKTNGIKTNGTSLEGTDEQSGLTVSGMGLLATQLTGFLPDGVTEVGLYIAAISDQDIPGRYTYTITEGQGGPNVCEGDAKAIPLNGRWDYATATFIDDPTQFTLACRGAALAKCIEMGYGRDGTWSDGGTSVDNRALHDACVRMIRADYCGNGVSHTQDGTLVDIFDKRGTQTETPNSGLSFEAEWGPNGATCIKRTRFVTAGAGNVEAYLGAAENATACGGRFVPNDTSCGVTWRAGGLVRNATGQNDHTSF